jgi:hypothetical protein
VGCAAKNRAVQNQAWFQALRPPTAEILQNRRTAARLARISRGANQAAKGDDATLPKIWTPCVAAGLAIENERWRLQMNQHAFVSKSSHVKPGDIDDALEVNDRK